MKISWFLKENDSITDLFDSEGTPPDVDSFVYIRDDRLGQIGASRKFKVLTVDNDIVLFSRDMNNFSFEEKIGMMENFIHPVEEKLRAKIFKLNFTDNRVEFSRSRAMVVIEKTETNERHHQEGT